MTWEQIYPVLMSILSGLGSYYGALTAIKVELARLEERVNSLEKRFESDHMKLDEHVTNREHP